MTLIKNICSLFLVTYRHEKFLWIDVLRAFAVILMIIYHICVDISFLAGYNINFREITFWRVFRCVVVILFTFIAGFCTYLSIIKHNNLGWLWRRVAKLIVIACIITLITYLVNPQFTIIFGTIHFFVIATILCVIASKISNRIFLPLAIGLFVVTVLFRNDMFNTPCLNWIGLETRKPVTLDYLPILPWIGFSLIGMHCARHLKVTIPIPAPINFNMNLQTRLLLWMGRKSLLIYIVHQPLFLGLIWCILKFLKLIVNR